MKQTLTSHVRIVHEKEKHQHFCSVCGKKFANRTLAAKHEEVVHFSKEPPEQGNLLKGIVNLLGHCVFKWTFEANAKCNNTNHV